MSWNNPRAAAAAAASNRKTERKNKFSTGVSFGGKKRNLRQKNVCTLKRRHLDSGNWAVFRAI